MPHYTIGEVKIDGGYAIKNILELSMNIAVNHHGFLTYGGLVPSSDALQLVQQSAEGQTISVLLRDETEFCGNLHEVSVENHGEHCYLRVTLVTSSQLMDTDLCDRFFQDTSHSFADIITEAYEDSGTGSLAATRGKEKIERPILQYRETDWQFTLRMAGRLGTIVIPNVTSEEPQVSLGIPKRQVYDESNNFNYTISRNAAEFRRKFAADKDTGYQNFLCYKMKSDNRYKLGDSVKIDGKVLTVMQKSLTYEQGEIQELYTLGHEQDFAVPLHHNKRIAGLELEGKVLDRSGQELQMLLDIDSARKDCGKTWFSYAPVTNNGMYSMPLEDEKVMLQWQSEHDDDVIAVRPDRKNSQDMLDPGERHFLSENESHLMMVPNKISYTNPVGSIEWLANKGFHLSTGKAVSISAQQDVIIKSQGQMQVNSPERITVCKSGTESSIDMLNNELHIKAAKKVTSTSKANKYKKTPLPERTQNFSVRESVASKLGAAVSMRHN